MSSFMEEIIRIKPIEIVHLNLHYSHVRVQDPRAVIRMADSIVRYAQIMPILVVTAEAPRYTLIDEQPQQIVHEDLATELKRADLGAIPKSQQSEARQRLLLGEMQRVFG